MEIYYLILISILLLILTLAIGILGFYLLFNMDLWISFYHAVAIMTSNSIIEEFENQSQLIFTTLYCLFSCLIFAGIIAFFIGLYILEVISKGKYSLRDNS